MVSVLRLRVLLLILLLAACVGWLPAVVLRLRVLAVGLSASLVLAVFAMLLVLGGLGALNVLPLRVRVH